MPQEYTGKKPAGNTCWIRALKSEMREDRRRKKHSREIHHERYHSLQDLISVKEYNRFLGITNHDPLLERSRDLKYMLRFRSKAYRCGDYETLDKIRKLIPPFSNISYSSYEPPVDGQKLLQEILVLQQYHSTSHVVDPIRNIKYRRKSTLI